MNVSMRLTVTSLVSALRGEAHAIADELASAASRSANRNATAQPSFDASGQTHSGAQSEPSDRPAEQEPYA